MIEVLDGGFLTTVQDAGRHGWARFGVPPSGPMDAFALRTANLLVGNDPGEAGLEITVAGPTLLTTDPCLVAVCGAEFELRAGHIRVPTWRAVFVRPGNVLRFEARLSGARAYLAISGGIVVPPFLGSRSTYLTGGFGGHEGRALAQGDTLNVGEAPPDLPLRAGNAWPAEMRPEYSERPILRVVVGPQDDHFTAEGIGAFLGSEYEVLPASNRIGSRLVGPRIAHSGSGEIVSDGIVAGSVQVPPDGQPIVMMADHPTTGGYPKIATVIQADLPLLAQCMPGDAVRFRKVDHCPGSWTMLS